MEDKASINYLKELLFLEVKDLLSKEREIVELRDSITNVTEIINTLSIEDYSQLYDSLIYISLLIDYVLSMQEETKEERIKQTLNNKLLSCVYLLKHYQSKGLTDIDEYNKNLNELSTIIEVFKAQLFKLENKLESLSREYNKHLMIEYRRIISKFKYRQIITPEDIKIIGEFLDKKQVDNKNQVIIFERIKNHNFFVEQSQQSNTYFSKEARYAIINMLNTGFEVLEAKKTISRTLQRKLEEEKEQLLNMISHYEDDVETMMELLPKVQDKVYSLEEIQFILLGILEEYQNKIYSQIELISDKDFYMDEEIRDNVKLDYYKYIKIYNLIRSYYDKIEEEIKRENIVVEEENKNEEPIKEPTKKLIYARNENNVGYFEIDLDRSNIPEEYYEGILDLLNRFKTDELLPRETKQLVGNINFKQFRELKSDQIRIVYRQIVGNYYCILGVGVKKANSDLPLYKKLTSRPFISTTNIEELEREIEISKEIEEKIIKFCTEEARKSHR